MLNKEQLESFARAARTLELSAEVLRSYIADPSKPLNAAYFKTQVTVCLLAHSDSEDEEIVIPVFDVMDWSVDEELRRNDAPAARFI